MFLIQGSLPGYWDCTILPIFRVTLHLALFGNRSLKHCLPSVQYGNIGAEFFYYRTTNGAEVDFVMKVNHAIFAIECKASYAPVLSKGNYLSIEDVAPRYTFIVTPSPDSWPMKENIDVVSLDDLKLKIDSLI